MAMQRLVVDGGPTGYALCAAALVILSFTHILPEQPTAHDASVFQTPLAVFGTLTLFYIAIFMNLMATPKTPQRIQKLQQLKPCFILNILCCVTSFLQYMDWVPVYLSPRGETMYPLQFVEWSVTVPILCWMYFSRCHGVKIRAYLATLAAAQGMVVSLVIASFTEGAVYAFALVATILFAVIVIYLSDSFLALSLEQMQHCSRAARLLSLASWALYAVLFALQSGGVLGRTFCLFYTFVQVVHKSLMSFFIELQYFMKENRARAKKISVEIEEPKLLEKYSEDKDNISDHFLHYSDVDAYKFVEPKGSGAALQTNFDSQSKLESFYKGFEVSRFLHAADSRSHIARSIPDRSSDAADDTNRVHVNTSSSNSVGPFSLGDSVWPSSGSDQSRLRSPMSSAKCANSGVRSRNWNESYLHPPLGDMSGGTTSDRGGSKNKNKNVKKNQGEESSNSDGSEGSRTSGFSGDSVDGSGRDFPTSEEASNSDSRNHSDSPPPFTHFFSGNGSISDSTSSSDYGGRLRNRKHQRALNQEIQRRSSEYQDDNNNQPARRSLYGGRAQDSERISPGSSNEATGQDDSASLSASLSASFAKLRALGVS